MPVPAIVQDGRHVKEYPVDAAATFVEGALVLLAADGELEEAGADPAQVLGFSLHDAGAGIPSSVVLVAVAKPQSTFWISGSADPVIADIGDIYGAAKDATGIWILDKTETTANVFVIEDVDLTRNLYLVKILDAAAQLGV